MFRILRKIVWRKAFIVYQQSTVKLTVFEIAIAMEINVLEGKTL